MGCGSDGVILVLSSQSCQLLEGRCGKGPSSSARLTGLDRETDRQYHVCWAGLRRSSVEVFILMMFK